MAESDLSQMRAIRDRDGVRALLGFLNGRTAHRFTALYRFDGPTLRSAYFFDSEQPAVESSPDIPVMASYCVFVRDSNHTFVTPDAPADERTAGHPKRFTVRSYCGVPLIDERGVAFGSICHFDFAAVPFAPSDVELLESEASLLPPPPPSPRPPETRGRSRGSGETHAPMRGAHRRAEGRLPRRRGEVGRRACGRIFARVPRMYKPPSLWCCAAVMAAGCAAPLRPEAFSQTAPAFDPMDFWSRPTASWGVIENRGGAPTAIVTTTTEATPEAAGLHLVQHVMTGGKETVRDWHLRRLGENRFEATANDMVGAARGSSSGRTFHWTWTLATKPGHALSNVKMEQWMYLADNGTLMNRTMITKLGVRLAEVSEQFVRRP